jgi:hypothetical protein
MIKRSPKKGDGWQPMPPEWAGLPAAVGSSPFFSIKEETIAGHETRHSEFVRECTHVAITAGDNKYLTTEITDDISHVGQLIAEGLLRVQVKNNRRKSNPPKQKLKMVKASNRHPTSSTTTSSTATVQQQQQSDPLRGVMATSKEQVEIQMYLSKLKELVPHMPKNRKVSKLEVIQHVIDYICDLQSELEQNHPASLNRNRRKQHSAAVLAARRATTDASVIASGASLSHPSAASSAVHRQPLGLLTSIPNTSIEVELNSN